ncbi:MAG: ethanolamine utilization protein EutN [Chloroflexi bacterium]|nr:MAG: ethanolamine utilization protein EutN [Phototrophicales bacterium]RMF77450.1 MAG: ethanolamine utilization protein EutN [Chloroflexota bacterium]
MIIAEVVGTVVATQKPDHIQGLPLRIVRKLTVEAETTNSYVIAVDVVGASPGEIVLVASGSSARQTRQTDSRPIDAVIMAIVDTWQVQDVVKYEKTGHTITS